MQTYRTIHDLIRDGMYMRAECRKCRFVETVDPADIKNYVAQVYRGDAILKSYRFEPVGHGNPDITLRGCLDGINCPVCLVADWMVGVIKAPEDDEDEDGD